MIVGALMMKGSGEIDWSHFDEGLPAFLTIAAMPFTYSIANGISFGVVSWVAIKLLRGRFREVHPLLLALSLLLVAFYGFLGRT